MNAKDVRKRLLELKDEGYRSFTSKLIPTVDPERITRGQNTTASKAFASRMNKRNISVR